MLVFYIFDKFPCLRMVAGEARQRDDRSQGDDPRAKCSNRANFLNASKKRTLRTPGILRCNARTCTATRGPCTWTNAHDVVASEPSIIVPCKKKRRAWCIDRGWPHVIEWVTSRGLHCTKATSQSDPRRTKIATSKISIFKPLLFRPCLLLLGETRCLILHYVISYICILAVRSARFLRMSIFAHLFFKILHHCISGYIIYIRHHKNKCFTYFSK